MQKHSKSIFLRKIGFNQSGINSWSYINSLRPVCLHFDHKQRQIVYYLPKRIFLAKKSMSENSATAGQLKTATTFGNGHPKTPSVR